MFVLSPYFFFFNDTATTEIYTLSLHDALPILARAAPGEVRRHRRRRHPRPVLPGQRRAVDPRARPRPGLPLRGDRKEHTSELQSRQYLVCRLLLEKKKTNTTRIKTDKQSDSL